MTNKKTFGRTPPFSEESRLHCDCITNLINGESHARIIRKISFSFFMFYSRNRLFADCRIVTRPNSHSNHDG